MNKYLLAAALVLGIVVFFLVKSNLSLRNTSQRLTTNLQEVVEENKQFILKYDELNKVQKARIDELADSLKIKPKFVQEYINVVIHDTIRDTIQVTLVQTEPFTYKFTEDTACFHIEGLINNKDQKPKLSFTNLEYDNTIEGVLYLQRKQWKIWFIKSRFLGHKEAKLETFSKCGKSTIDDIKIIKK